MQLSKYEQETIINYNQGDAEASCYTHDPKLIKRLDELAQKRKEVALVREAEGMREYTIPKKWVKVRAPKEYSEEQKAKMAANARARFGHIKEDSDDERIHT